MDGVGLVDTAVAPGTGVELAVVVGAALVDGGALLVATLVLGAGLLAGVLLDGLVLGVV